MKALVIREYGDADNLQYEEIATPTVTCPNDVIVQVKAAGVNPVDFKMRKGFLKAILPLSMPIVLGIDYSGIVTEVGSAVTSVKPGDEVFGKIGMPSSNGTYSEFVKLNDKKDAIVLKPENVSWEQAGSVGVACLTAYYQLVTQGGLKKGDSKRVLVIGASGGVGSFAVQIGKALGCHVTGICSTANIGFVKSLGADEVIDYKSQVVAEALKKLPLFDVVCDTVGGDDYFLAAEPCITKGGVYSTAVGPRGGDDAITIIAILGVIGTIFWRLLFSSVNYKWVMLLPPVISDDITQWLKEGNLKPVVSDTFSFKDGIKAHKQSETGRTLGKIVLVP